MMPVSADYRDYVLEQLAGAGRVTPRPMFGGVGLYLDGLFFALIDDDTLYFKADEASRKRYEEAGSRPFCPDPSRPEHAMGYWQVPADVLEDPDSLASWAREALAVALSKRGKRGRRRPVSQAPRASRR
jgi:DNA transformation protein